MRFLPILAAFFFVIALPYRALALGTLGFDASQTLTLAHMQCLYNSGYRFFIGRVWRSNGVYDQVGAQNIKNARAAGMISNDGYIFPCLSARCGNGSNQVKNVVDHLRMDNVTFGTLWLDVEIFNWLTDTNENRQFIRAMVQQAQNMNVNVGIYTAPEDWESIVGGDFDEFGRLPLWWPDWSGQQDMNGFTPFGGWTKPETYNGDVSDQCGVNLDQDYYFNFS